MGKLSIQTLFRQTVTLVRTVTDDRDAIGGAEPGTETTTTVDGYLEPVDRVTQGRVGEDLEDRGTLIGDWVLFLPPETDITGWDRARYEGHEFSVLGPPREWYDALTGTLHHLEVDLREVR